MARRVLLLTRDLLFRAKLGAVVAAVGGEVTKDEAECEVAVIELGVVGAAERIKSLVGRGVSVVAFGSHVAAEPLRVACEAGAVAVPNSQVERVLRGLMGAEK